LNAFFLWVGHEVTEDYSSYESVDEEEEVPEKPAKGKGKKKITAPTKVKDEGEAEEAKEKEKEKAAKQPLARSASTLKRKPSKPSVQKGGIASYFNKK
jgi:DNA polymerase delta subunit 3